MTLDEHGYPDDASLAAIESCDVVGGGVEALLKLVRENWWMPDWGFRRDGDRLELHTGGWSGNEDVIDALGKNTMFWAIYWESSRRGGHYRFDLARVQGDQIHDSEDP